MVVVGLTDGESSDDDTAAAVEAGRELSCERSLLARGVRAMAVEGLAVGVADTDWVQSES